MKVKVGAHRYPVYRDSVHLAEDGNWAEHRPRNRLMHVDTRERPDTAIAEDLVHEILHAAFLDAGHVDPHIDHDIEERVCSLLAPRLTAVIADNVPGALELIASRLRVTPLWRSEP